MRKTVPSGLVIALLFAGPTGAQARLDPSQLETLVDAGDTASIRTLGPAVLPPLARLYAASATARKAEIARIFYELGWKSPEAKRELMADVHTSDPELRLQVQWALGRVSADADVIDALLDNLRNDAVPLFRDKAACALAYDQIHLAPAQKLRLYEGLIGALDDEKPQVRQVAAQALRILTGQTKGYAPGATALARRQAIDVWRKWLLELRANL